MSIRKTPLQQAILEAKEIEKVAFEAAKKSLEEAIAPKIEQAVRESLKELENDTIEEGTKIEVSTDGAVTITTGEESSQPSIAVVGQPESIGTEFSDESSAEVESPEIETQNTEIQMDEIQNLEEELFEVEADAPAPDAPVDVPMAPAEAPIEVPAEASAPATSENPFEAINQKLDAILNKVGTESAPGESAEGEVEIVDDETAVQPGATPEAPAPVTEMENEVMYELDNEEEGLVRETDSGMFDEMSDLEEIEIVDEENPIEEDSLMRRHRAGQLGKIGKMPLGKYAPHSDHATSLKEGKEIKENKAQNESAMDELKQENESLKKTLKEYKESFVVLRKQINEVQVFNAKLAYANKLFVTGGLKNEEKVRIAEEFDKVSTVEGAKKLYNTLLKEVSEVSSSKTAPEEKLKSVKPSVQPQAEQSQALYESTEIKRMKLLAGILSEGK